MLAERLAIYLCIKIPKYEKKTIHTQKHIEREKQTHIFYIYMSFIVQAYSVRMNNNELS